MPILKSERTYWDVLRKQYEQLEALYQEIKSQGKLSLDGHEISKAILFRMKTYYEVHNRIKSLLNKRYVPPASDFFVEAVAFYLKALLHTHNTGLDLHSERQIGGGRRALRPDISIWRGAEVVAAIECKTQLGWNRAKWEDDFRSRERKLREKFSKAQAFLLVMTERNWSGFRGSDEKVGKQFFALLRSEFWPTDITNENIEEALRTPIEDLFRKILAGATLQPS